MVAYGRAPANRVQSPSKTQLLFLCCVWDILLHAHGREAAQSLASEPAPSHEKLFLNFGELWLRQEKRVCFEKDTASSRL